MVASIKENMKRGMVPFWETLQDPSDRGQGRTLGGGVRSRKGFLKKKVTGEKKRGGKSLTPMMKNLNFTRGALGGIQVSSSRTSKKAKNAQDF